MSLSLSLSFFFAISLTFSFQFLTLSLSLFVSNLSLYFSFHFVYIFLPLLTVFHPSLFLNLPPPSHIYTLLPSVTNYRSLISAYVFLSNHLSFSDICLSLSLVFVFLFISFSFSVSLPPSHSLSPPLLSSVLINFPFHAKPNPLFASQKEEEGGRAEGAAFSEDFVLF